MRIPNPYYELFNSLVYTRQYRWGRWWGARSDYWVGYRHWRRAIRSSPRLSIPGPEKLTVILLSYKRVRNMEPIAEAALRCDFVEKVVVSNNNPEVRIGDWIRLRDERLVLVDQPRRTPPGSRFRLAREEPGFFFLSIDDDVLLTPEQIRILFAGMVARPGAPHGILGENYAGDAKPGYPPYWEVNQLGRDMQVDTLNTVYGFNRGHLNEMARLAECLGIDLDEMGNGEDVLLSASGAERAWVHDVGPVALCLSSHRAGVATWASRPRFFTDRKDLFLNLRELRPDLGIPVGVEPSTPESSEASLATPA
jgi:hypothetical protein